MSNKGQLLQDPFLNLLRKEHVPVSIYLVNGIAAGHIESFDQYVVLLRNTVTQMVYKHAISTVVPGGRELPPDANAGRPISLGFLPPPRGCRPSHRAPASSASISSSGAAPGFRREPGRTGAAGRIRRRFAGGPRRWPAAGHPMPRCSSAPARSTRSRRWSGSSCRSGAVRPGLSPAQQRNLERHLGVPVADRMR